jgi:hypothetical protein
MKHGTLPGSARASRAIFGASPNTSADLVPQGPLTWFKKSPRSRGRDCQHAGRVRSPLQLGTQ